MSAKEDKELEELDKQLKEDNKEEKPKQSDWEVTITEGDKQLEDEFNEEFN